MTSGVPILNKIPILQALFERKGHYTQNRKLLILLKALIVIPAEHEPTPAQMGDGWGMGALNPNALRPQFRTWIDGLRKAGLDIPDEPPATG